MSPEATRGLQGLYAADIKATKVPDPTDLAAWRQLQAYSAANNPRAEAAQAVLPKLGGSLIDAKLGGVPVIDVRPRGWDKADRRLIIYVHGGAFTFNSARTTVANAARLAAKSGIRVISVDYTLAPEANWKIIQDQVLSVFKDLLDQGYRMTEMAIISDSAGGNLATRTVLTLRDNGLGMPAAVVLWAPWSDLTDEGDTAITLKDAEPILSYNNILEPSARAYAAGLDLKDPRVSPLYADFMKGFPPTLIQDSTRTTFLSTSVRLYRKLEAAGAQPVLDLYEGMWHVFQADLVPPPSRSQPRSSPRGCLLRKSDAGRQLLARSRSPSAVHQPLLACSYEQVELLRNFVRALQHLRGLDGQPLAVEFYAIDINFAAITDPEEKRYFRNLPTSFVLSDEQVDRLREMAGRLLRQSPDYQRLLRDLGAAPSPQ